MYQRIYSLLKIAEMHEYNDSRTTLKRAETNQIRKGIVSLMTFVLLYIDLRHGQTCHSKDSGSCIFHWRERAWLTIWDRVKIPRYSHKLMHRKKITCELHDSYIRSMIIKTCHSKDDESGYSFGHLWE